MTGIRGKGDVVGGEVTSASLRDVELTHVDAQGRARMVDVGAKPVTARVARAAGKVLMAPSTLELVRTGGTRKGDVLAVAQVAGIMAAKRTWELVPMCHQVPLSGVDISFAYEADGIAIEATARCKGKTGVEMEAMVAVSVAGLTIYDMCKSHQRDMVVEAVRLLEKDGGRSGHFVRAGEGGAVAGVAVDRTPSVSTGVSTSQAAAPVFSSGATDPSPSRQNVTNHPEESVTNHPEESVTGEVVAVCVSERKGTRKHPVDAISLEVGMGVLDDAHAGSWHRQVSLLPEEAVDELRHVLPDLAPGDFAENVLTRGLDLKVLPVGTTLEVGTALVAVTQIGKTCHNDCEIKRLVGTCAMPSEGVFSVVIRPGTVRAGDPVRVVRP